jgi:hypothetical protein
MWKYSSYPFATLPYKEVGGEHRTPGHFTPVKTWYPLYRRLGGHGTENLTLLEFISQTVQRICTNYTIPAASVNTNYTVLAARGSC